MKNTYATHIFWSEEDNCFIATVPALQGCMTNGRTRAEAAKHIEEAMEAWLDSAKKHSDPIPEPDSVAEELSALRPILNLSNLARLSGVNQRTLASKLRRGSRFSPSEAQAVRRVLESGVDHQVVKRGAGPSKK